MEIQRKDKASWRVNDKVINLFNGSSNISDHRVYNGQIGRVASINTEASSLIANFPLDDGGVATHRYGAGTTKLVHGWAVNTWKVQGDEMDGVVVIFPSRWQLSNELLYTSVTRAQRKVHVYISEYKLERCLKVASRTNRVTRLRERLQEILRESRKRPADEGGSSEQAKAQRSM